MFRVTYVKSYLVNCVWYALEHHTGRLYNDPANEFWSIGFARHTDTTYSVDLFGPSLRPRKLNSNKDEEYWGIEFNAHVFLKGLKKGNILDTHLSLQTNADSFVLCQRIYKIPNYYELQTFASNLEQDGILSSDLQIFRALGCNNEELSERSSQRRFRKVTGLTRKQIEQLQRARYAYSLLQQGLSQVDAAIEAGYSDQSHMIRAFKMLRGQTPARILSDHSHKS